MPICKLFRLSSSVRTLVVAGLALAASAPSAESADCVFANHGSTENSVSAFRVGPTRLLDEVQGSPFPTGGPAGFGSVSRNVASFGEFLYVVNAGDGPFMIGSVAGFVVQPDCSLETIPGSPWQAGFESVGIAIHPLSRRLYVASHAEESILRYNIKRDGSLAYEGAQYVGFGEGPFDLATSPNGRFLFATHHASADFVAYRIQRDGTLKTFAKYHAPAMFLHGLTVSRNGRFLYAVDLRNSNIHGVEFLPRGAFRPIPGSPWTTKTTPAGTTLSDVHLSPDDRYLFAALAHERSIRVYEVSARGRITERAGSPFPSVTSGPTSLEISPDGEVLIVLNGGRGGLDPCGQNCAAPYLLEDGVPIPDPAGPSSLGFGRSGSALYYVFEKAHAPGR